MKTILALAFVLVSSVGASAQLPRHHHKWSGNALKEEFRVQPSRPPAFVCNDGSLSYERSNGGLSHACEHNHGVRQHVENQFIALSGHVLTTSPDAPRGASARLEDAPANLFWLHPGLDKEKPKRSNSDANTPMVFNTPFLRLASWVKP